jgi:phosphatidylglycerophosphate synthase
MMALGLIEASEFRAWPAISRRDWTTRSCARACIPSRRLVEGRLAWWMLLALGARDLLFALGVLWYSLRGQAKAFRKMAPRAAGKVTTALQYLALACVVFGVTPPWPLLVATLALGLFAAAQYYADYQQLRSGKMAAS